LSAFIMGRSRPSKTIEAERFIVKDSSGKTRGEFGSDAGGATLTVGSLVEGERGTPGEKYLVTLHGGDYAWINLRSADTREYINGRLNAKANGGALLSLADGEDYETEIGNTALLSPLTGEKHSTSAASVVLLAKDKKVLWSAP
jgi:DNA helicase HerA-like ATPase